MDDTHTAGDVPTRDGPESDRTQVNRREALAIGATTIAVAGLPVLESGAVRAQPAPAPIAVGATLPLRFTVNGAEVEMTIDPRSSLLDVLRERLALTGAKKGCDHDNAARAPCMSPAGASPPA